MKLKKALPIAGAATAIGLVLGGTVFGPGAATAQESTATVEEFHPIAADHWREVLDPLVEEGTITATQADSVAEYLASTLPGRRGHFIGRGPGFAAFAEAAEIIGIENEELREALADGSTLAEVAEANGVDEQTLIDGLVAALTEKVEELVADGTLTDERAAYILENAPDRIENLVNAEIHIRRGFWLTPTGDQPADGG